MRIEHVAKVHLPVGGRAFRPGEVIPGELLKGRHIAPWIRKGFIELRGPGSEDAIRMYRAAPILGRTPSEALIRTAQLHGEGAEDEAPLLQVDDEYGEALERAGHTVEDAVEAAAEGEALENEEEVQAHLAEGVQRRRRRRR